MQNDRFQLDIMTQNDLDQCVLGLAKCFAQTQFMTQLHADQQNLKLFMRLIANVGLKRNLSVVIRDTIDGKIAGCYLNFDAGDQHQFQTHKLPQDIFAPLCQILNEASHQYLESHDAFHTFGQWVHIWIVGVFKEYQGQGLTKKMLDYSIKLFKQKGYKHACAELVNPLSQRAFVHSSKYFKAIKTVKYNDFTFNGVQPMKGAKGQVVFADCQLQTINII